MTRFGKIEIIAVIFILTLTFIPAAVHPAAAATQTQTGLMVPLYAYPTDSSWSELIQAKEAYPNVPIIAVIDPTSTGPGSSSDPNFVSGIESLQAAGITVVGYIDTAYGAESLSTVESWTADYVNWYHVNGIFFDCMSNDNGYQSYYSSATAYAYSLGLGLTVGNPGTTTLSSYVGTVNVLVIYENPGYPTASSTQSATMGYSANNFAVMAYDVSAPTQSYLSSVAQYVNWVYFTNGSGGDPYDVLPSFLDTMLSMLSSMDSTATSGSYQLTVDSENTLGNAVTGYSTELYSSSGSSLGTGFTPSTYTLSSGVSYQIEASSYGPCTFSHWSGGSLTGSTADPAVVSITGATTIEAVYSGSSCGSQAGSTSASITVESVNQDGDAITGYLTTLSSSSGSLISTEYTPETFTDVTAGTSYQIASDSYGSCTFENWQDTGSSVDPRTVTASGAQTFVGVYDCTSSGSVGQPVFAALLMTAIAGQVGMSIGFLLAALGLYAIVRTTPFKSLAAAAFRPRWW